MNAIGRRLARLEGERHGESFAVLVREEGETWEGVEAEWRRDNPRLQWPPTHSVRIDLSGDERRAA
jgi:hypothetical protein